MQEVEIKVGDVVEIESQGVIRCGPASYVCKDGEFWMIEGTDPKHGAFYWKQRSDGGRLLAVERAESETAPTSERPLQADGRVKNGVFTLVSHKSNEHRAFRIATVNNPQSGLNGKRIMSLLTGPNNESDYIGFAFVEDDNSLAVWGRFRGTLTSDMGRCLMAFLTRGTVAADGSVRVPTINGHVLFKSACRVCNRPLTCPESIRTGIGPVCAGR